MQMASSSLFKFFSIMYYSTVHSKPLLGRSSMIQEDDSRKELTSALVQEDQARKHEHCIGKTGGKVVRRDGHRLLKMKEESVIWQFVNKMFTTQQIIIYSLKNEKKFKSVRWQTRKDIIVRAHFIREIFVRCIINIHVCVAKLYCFIESGFS